MNLVNQHIPEDDLALFALGLMPPEDAAFTLEHLKQCEHCRSIVAGMQGDLATYALSVEMQDPAPQARARLLDAVAKEPRIAAPATAVVASDAPPRGEVREMPRRRGMGVAGWAGWAVAAGVTAMAGWQFHQSQTLHEQLVSQTAALQQVNSEAARAQQVLHTLTDPAAMQVALHLPAPGAAPPKPEGHASYNASRGELVFVATHLQPLQANKTYELWVLPADNGAPVPAGVFKPDVNGNASVVLPELPKNVPAKAFGVTIEAEGGSKTPTMPIVLAGSSA